MKSRLDFEILGECPLLGFYDPAAATIFLEFPDVVVATPLLRSLVTGSDTLN